MSEDDNMRHLWEVGLPGTDDLTPLSLQLIPSELASAFRISPESSKTMHDVTRASENTFSSLQRWHSQDLSSVINITSTREEEILTETDQGSDPRKIRRVESGGVEDADSAMCNDNDDDDSKMHKRARLVWTPQLHKRFVEVVAHIGIKNAVPKTIMQLMNVEGLTRENVASHLQKYRLYMKRQSNDQGPSNSSDHHLRKSGESTGHVRNSNGHVAMMQYPQQMMPMPMIGMGNGGHLGMPVGFHHHQYSNMVQQQRGWSGNNFGYYHPVASNDK